MSAAFLLSALFPAAVEAGTPNDLERRAVTKILGGADEEGVGYALAPAGDVNGDGIDDLIVRPHHFSREHLLAYVVFGGSSDPVDVAILGDRGFAMTLSENTAAGDLRSYELTGISSVGDVNDDGRDDIAVGVPWADPRGRTNAGSVFVVFGKSDPDPVDVSTPTSAIRIDGADKGDELGVAIGTAEVSGDGDRDLLLGAPFAGAARPNPGRVYVVSGSELAAPIDLALPFEGYWIQGRVGRQAFGSAIAGAGDQNGDGLEDIVIGGPSDSYRVRSATFLAYSSASAADVVVGSEAWRGWELRAPKDGGDGGDLGRAVAGGADFDGDGAPDVLVGAPEIRALHGDSGAAYVIFGGSERTGRTLATELGDAGVKIVGPHRLAGTGYAVALIPDVDSDGRAEALVGSPLARPFGEYDAGRADLVRGTDDRRRIDLAAHAGSLTYMGERSASAGFSVAWGGDFTAQDTPALAIGAPEAGSRGLYRRGIVHVVPATEPATDLPPRAFFLGFRARQEGKEGSYCWDGVCVDRIPSVPRSRPAGMRDPALIRLWIEDRPEDTALTYHTRLDEYGRPAGRARALDHRVTRSFDSIGGRRVGYGIDFRLPPRTGPLYLVLQARWAGLDEGDATWFFHLDLDRTTYTDIESPPESHLLTGSTRQRGLMLSYSWSEHYLDGFSSNMHADAFWYGFPRAKPGVHGARARIRINERHRPNRLVIRLYRRVKQVGEGPFASEYGAGRRRLVDFSWRRVRRDGRVVAHDALFRLPRRGRHAYYEVRGRWYWHGTAPWQFHLRLRG